MDPAHAVCSLCNSDGGAAELSCCTELVDGTFCWTNINSLSYQQKMDAARAKIKHYTMGINAWICSSSVVRLIVIATNQLDGKSDRDLRRGTWKADLHAIKQDAVMQT